MGIEAGFAWRTLADFTAIYTDLGVSNGMLAGRKHAEALNAHREALGLSEHGIVYRSIPDWNS